MSESEKSATPTKIYLVSYPKVVFLYPTFLVGLIAGISLSISGAGPDDPISRIMTSVFLGVLGVNLVVLSFDFPRSNSLTLFFFLAAVVFGLFLAIQFNDNIVPFLKEMVRALRPVANATFFHIFSGVMVLIYIAVLWNVQFDYWEVSANELLHHHGILSDLERYSAPNLRFTKEITDVFEYALLRSGRLILHPSNEPRSIVLDNVPFITRKEEQLTRLLGALQVQVRTEQST